MRCFSRSLILCVVGLTSAGAEPDSIPPADTNLIALCVSRSDVAAHVRVSSLANVRQQAEPEVFDLAVFHGQLITLEVKQLLYLRKGAAAEFPKNIYIYRVGFARQPILHMGQEYLVFLKRDETPAIVNSGMVTDPAMPTTNYFTFALLPDRLVPRRRAYVKLTDTNSLASIEQFLLEGVVPRQRAKGSWGH